MNFDQKVDEQKLRSDPQQWLKGFEEQAKQLQQQAERAEAALSAAEVTLTSRDQSVTVTVNSGGGLQALYLSPRAEGMTLLQLQATIMDVYQQACRAAAQQTQQIIGELVGDDSGAMEFLRRVLPATDDEGAAP